MVLRKILGRLFDLHRGDKERIVRAFPIAIHEDVRSALKILPFENHTLRLADGRFHFVDNFVSDYRPLLLALREEEVELPYRIYLEEPKDTILSTLTELQQRIVSCIYLRHHNGFVRQKHLERLFGATDDFICPFAVQLIGEYVIEILYDIEKLIVPEVLPQYAAFVAANPLYWKQTESRMISYWNEYYRGEFPKLKVYVGKRLVDRLSGAVREFV
jgi:hypothetical protein